MPYRKRDIYTLKNMYKNDEYDNILFLCFFFSKCHIILIICTNILYPLEKVSNKYL